jgi:hypothetical protein
MKLIKVYFIKIYENKQISGKLSNYETLCGSRDKKPLHGEQCVLTFVCGCIPFTYQ